VSGHAQFLASLSGSSDGDPMAFFVFWDACFFNKTVYSDFLSFKTETTGTGAETTLERQQVQCDDEVLFQLYSHLVLCCLPSVTWKLEKKLTLDSPDDLLISFFTTFSFRIGRYILNLSQYHSKTADMDGNASACPLYINLQVISDVQN
jgi:hypothetical protein